MEVQLELYKKWAPDDALWTQWVKPVVFMNMGDRSQPHAAPDLKCAAISWITYEPETAIIVDLPGKDGLKEGLGLAGLGYRPIPLYNGVPALVSPDSKAAVPMEEIVEGMWSGVDVLEGCPISKTANPAFILDSRRLEGTKKQPGIFDNRWCVVPQDMPSADYFKEHHISRIVVRTGRIREDLQHLLFQYQSSGIDIYIRDSSQMLIKEKIGKPSRYRTWFYRFLVLFGLVRSATGGFGSAIPLPLPSASSGHHYRAG